MLLIKSGAGHFFLTGLSFLTHLHQASGHLHLDYIFFFFWPRLFVCVCVCLAVRACPHPEHAFLQFRGISHLRRGGAFVIGVSELDTDGDVSRLVIGGGGDISHCTQQNESSMRALHRVHAPW